MKWFQFYSCRLGSARRKEVHYRRRGASDWGGSKDSSQSPVPGSSSPRDTRGRPGQDTADAFQAPAQHKRGIHWGTSHPSRSLQQVVSAGESLACAGFCGSAGGYLLKPDNASPAWRAPVRHQTLIKSVLLLEGRAAEEAAAFPSLQQLASKELLTSPAPCTPAPHIHRDWGKSRSCCFSEQSPPAQLSHWFRCRKHTHLETEPAPGSPSAQQPRGICLGTAPCCSPQHSPRAMPEVCIQAWSSPRQISSQNCLHPNHHGVSVP